MKAFAVIIILIVPSIGFADDWANLNLVRSISINRPTEEPSRIVNQSIEALNNTIRSSYPMVLNSDVDVLQSGKLFSALDFSTMEAEEAGRIVNSNHCEISDAFDLYQPAQALTGELLIHSYSSVPAFLINGSSQIAGIDQMLSIYYRDYYVVPASNRNDVSAFIRCYSILTAHSQTEMQGVLESYKAQAPLRDLKDSLGL